MRRGSGILLHITSLPSPFGIGDLGEGAYRFADFLHRGRQRYWQILPLCPTDPDFDDSPYHCTSAYACNPMLIDLESLVREGLLSKDDLAPLRGHSEERVEYEKVVPLKTLALKKAFDRFKAKGEGREAFVRFCDEEAGWLDDFSLFTALKDRHQGTRWNGWPVEIRDRSPSALKEARKALSDPVEEVKFFQFVFYRQWRALKAYCNGLGIEVIGDIPIYLDFDGVDLWTHPELFKLDEDKNPYVKAGVPPDCFSETGQLWGNPIYRWEAIRADGYGWWIDRIRHNLALFDWARIDHFRGLVAFWEVPASEETALNGSWVKAPARDFLTRLSKELPELPVIAEDLGMITPDVREIMEAFNLPGMRPILFAFDGDPADNPYLPHKVVENSVAYTGTHDNNTVRGWFENEASPDQKKKLFDYLGRETPAEEVSWDLIRLVEGSKAAIAVVPLQDLLGLDQRARMNRPGVTKGNWRWRVTAGQISEDWAEKLGELARSSGRC